MHHPPIANPLSRRLPAVRALACGLLVAIDTETFAPDQAWGLRAVHPGDATITSTGRLNCKPGEVCPLFLELFSVHVHVDPSY